MLKFLVNIATSNKMLLKLPSVLPMLSISIVLVRSDVFPVVFRELLEILHSNKRRGFPKFHRRFSSLLFSILANLEGISLSGRCVAQFHTMLMDAIVAQRFQS